MPPDGSRAASVNSRGRLGLAIGCRHFGIRVDSAAEFGGFSLGKQIVNKFEQSLAYFGVHDRGPPYRRPLNVNCVRYHFPSIAWRSFISDKRIRVFTVPNGMLIASAICS